MAQLGERFSFSLYWNMVFFISQIRKKKFNELTHEEVSYLRSAGILNGFWGASQSWIVKWLIGSILADFDEAIPDYHDFGYWIGGDENRRKECDENFWVAMGHDIYARYHRKEIGKWECLTKVFISNLAYYSIRWKGSKFFNYHTYESLW